MTTPQPAALPELPEPDLYAHELILNGGGVWLGVPEKGICEQAHIEGETGEEIREFYTADRMRAYALAALQSQPAAEVSDEEIIAIKKATKAADPTQPWGDTLAFARAILALRPQAVPMTGKQARLLSREELAGCCGGCASNSAIETWMRRAIEKFCEVNGITAPAGGEGANLLPWARMPAYVPLTAAHQATKEPK